MITSSDIEPDRHNQSFILRCHIIYEVSATISMQCICVTEKCTDTANRIYKVEVLVLSHIYSHTTIIV